VITSSSSFTASQAWRLSGYLTTRIANDAGGVTYDVHPIPSSPGSCRNARCSRRRTASSSREVRYLPLPGGKFTPLLGRANSLYWRSLMSNRVVLGSHMLNDDFYVLSVGRITP
jgi:hypothetical protein